MELNPHASKGPEQSRDVVTSQLIVALAEEAEALIQPEHTIFQHPIDMQKFHAFTKAAYEEEIDAKSAYLQVEPFVSSLFVTLEDDSYLEYRIDDVVVETSTKAVVSHFIESRDGKSAELIGEREMDLTDLIVFIRSLDSIKKTDSTQSN